MSSTPPTSTGCSGGSSTRPPSRWGRGIASAALRAFLEIETTRPLCGRVAAHNLGSARVLERAGFVRVGSDAGFAAGAGREVVEHLYELAR
ncbi:GNAT family N-acetyltransferase [Nocardioides sp.]|uniref:GNAT family N-acetyltransferase n=1 Tax=Nocardioides sp. TaxID=35761 RepID=UPI00352799B7